MLMVVSPAKALDETSAVQTEMHTQAELLNQAEILANEMKQVGPVELGQLIHISDKISDLNYERFQACQHPFPQY